MMKSSIDNPRSGTSSAPGSEPASLGTVPRYLAANYRRHDGAPLAEADAARVALRRISVIEHGVRRLCLTRDVGDEIAHLEGLIQDAEIVDEGDGW